MWKLFYSLNHTCAGIPIYGIKMGFLLFGGGTNNCSSPSRLACLLGLCPRRQQSSTQYCEKRQLTWKLCWHLTVKLFVLYHEHRLETLPRIKIYSSECWTDRTLLLAWTDEELCNPHFSWKSREFRFIL